MHLSLSLSLSLSSLVLISPASSSVQRCLLHLKRCVADELSSNNDPPPAPQCTTNHSRQLLSSPPLAAPNPAIPGSRMQGRSNHEMVVFSEMCLKRTIFHRALRGDILISSRRAPVHQIPDSSALIASTVLGTKLTARRPIQVTKIGRAHV